MALAQKSAILVWIALRGRAKVIAYRKLPVVTLAS